MTTTMSTHQRVHEGMRRAEAALRKMTWTPTPTIPVGILHSFEGRYAGTEEAWTCVVCSFVLDGETVERCDGAACCTSEGLIVRLTPGLAAMAFALAEAATAA